MLLRKCCKCGLEAYNEKYLEYFCKDKRSSYGHKNLCKKCQNRMVRTRWKPSRDRLNKKWNPINHPINDPKAIEFLGKRIYLKENPRTNICSKCDRKYPEELKQQTCIHHEIYDPENILAHTTELCKSCHMKLHHKIRQIPQQVEIKM